MGITALAFNVVWPSSNDKLWRQGCGGGLEKVTHIQSAMCISWTVLAFPLCWTAKRAFRQQLSLVLSLSGTHSCMCIIQAEDSCGGRNQELTWLRLYDSVNSLFLCVPRPCILETLSRLPPLVSLSLRDSMLPRHAPLNNPSIRQSMTD